MRETVNHYKGNSGQVRRVEDHPSAPERTVEQQPKPPQQPKSRPVQPPPPVSRRPPSPLSGLSGELGRFLGKFSSVKLETDDLLLLLILYLMYRESRDEELLYIMAGVFLF